MSEHVYEFNIPMSCNGCTNAVKNVVKKLDGIKSCEADFNTKKATIITEDEVTFKTVYHRIRDNTSKPIEQGFIDGKEVDLDLYK